VSLSPQFEKNRAGLMVDVLIDPTPEAVI